MFARRLPAAHSARARGACRAGLAAGLVVIGRGLLLGWMATSSLAQAATPAPAPASQPSQQMLDWVLDSRDNLGLPFIIVDKAGAEVSVFTPQGGLRGKAPALLGLALGDESVPGIGQRPLASISPQERTTPAGRYVANLDRNLHGVGILWIDYDLALSLHRVVAGTAREQRSKRLASPSPLDNRISFGCVNVPVDFYEKVVEPAFTGTNGIVYILPETHALAAVFPTYYVAPTAPDSLARARTSPR